jgi:hypothetical protein
MYSTMTRSNAGFAVPYSVALGPMTLNTMLTPPALSTTPSTYVAPLSRQGRLPPRGLTTCLLDGTLDFFYATLVPTGEKDFRAFRGEFPGRDCPYRAPCSED